MRYRQKNRARPFRAVFFALLVFSGIVATALIYLPETPLPDEWNPTKPLRVADDVTPLTRWKLHGTANDPVACVAALQEAGDIRVRPPVTSQNPGCYITAPVEMRAVGLARMSGIQTNCATALRVAMWEKHSLQPAARLQLGTEVSAINDIGSYNCRAMRTSAGVAARLSSHATASAIDISGFRFTDGSSLSITRDWDGSDNAAAFLRAARNGACDWFPLTLSPDYNDLHSDHFHLQATGWSLCD